MFELPNRYTDMQRISLIVDAGVQERLLFSLGNIFGGVVGLVIFRLATTVVPKHSHLVNAFIVMLCFFFFFSRGLQRLLSMCPIEYIEADPWAMPEIQCREALSL